MASKKGVVMYYDILEQLEDFSDEQFGKITRAIINYDKTGDIPEFEDFSMKVAFKMLKPILDRNKQEYEELCEKNRQNVQKRWQKQNTTVYECIPNDTKHTDNDIDNDIDKENNNIIVTSDNAEVEKKAKTKKQTPSVVSGLSADMQDIFDFWNTLDIVKHRQITSKIQNALTKAISLYSAYEIKKAMSNYNTVIKDTNYFFNYVWSIDTFLKQSNGLAHFVDSGEKWLNYCQKKGIKPNEEKKAQEVKQISENVFHL